MSRYTSITNDIWLDGAFRKLSAIEKATYLYVLTSPYNTPSGIYRLPIDCVAFALGEEGAEAIKKPNTLYVYDEEAEVVLIPNYLKYNVAKSPQQINGVLRTLGSIPNCKLLVDFFINFVKYCGEEHINKVPKATANYVIRQALERGTLEAINIAQILETHQY